MNTPENAPRPRPTPERPDEHGDPAFGAVAALIALACLAPMAPEWAARFAAAARNWMVLLVESASGPIEPPF